MDYPVQPTWKDLLLGLHKASIVQDSMLCSIREEECGLGSPLTISPTNACKQTDYTVKSSSVCRIFCDYT